MIERADQLVLDYVSKVADAAHGVLPPRRRIDFIAGLRRRIDAARAGKDDPAVVAGVLAGFGDPVELVGRELRRLGEEETARSPEAPAGASGASDASGHTSSVRVPPAQESPASASASTSTPAPASTVSVSPVVVPSPSVPLPSGSPLAAPSPDDPRDPPDPRDPGDTGDPRDTDDLLDPGDPRDPGGLGAPGGSRSPDGAAEAGVPPPRRPVRGHPYAPMSFPDAADSPERSSAWDRRAEEWEDALEADPPTEEIPPVRDRPAPDPLVPSVPDPRVPPVPPVPDPLAPVVPDPLAPPVPGPAGPPTKAPGKTPGDGPGGAGVRPGMPPGVARGIREAEERLARKQARRRPGLLRRSRPPRSREDIVPGTQDARTILLSHRRETIGMILLTLAGLLIPFPFAPIAIFTIPVLVWAVGALVVVACQEWTPSDKVIGIASPMLSYTLGGGLVALVRAREDLGRVVEEFFTISGLMFLLGTAWGVFWLTYRLLNPVIQPGRGHR